MPYQQVPIRADTPALMRWAIVTTTLQVWLQVTSNESARSRDSHIQQGTGRVQTHTEHIPMLEITVMLPRGRWYPWSDGRYSAYGRARGNAIYTRATELSIICGVPARRETAIIWQYSECPKSTPSRSAEF
ncbi:hypothetical protein NXS19_002035 [Fusarium pseudograminearum]|nr:hypothetical protein NXS19_002035 [Fusarium pseudograminearum]